MTPIKSFAEVLAHRGRILLFTPSASVALPCEQMAARLSAEVVCTRGLPDSYIVLNAWRRVNATQAFAVFSTDQSRFVAKPDLLQATDIVWVGNTGHPRKEPHLWLCFSHAMSRAGDDARLWLLPLEGEATPK